MHSAIGPVLSGDTLSDGPTPDERTALVRVSQPLLRSGDVLVIRVRDRDGRVAFDPRHIARGVVGEPDDEVVDAIEGEKVVLLTRVGADDVDTGAARGPRAIEVYTPVFAGNSGAAVGAVEVYVPYAPIAAGIDRSYSQIRWIVLLGLLGVWIVLGVITWSVTRRLRRSNADNRFLARRDPLTRMANRFAIVEDVQTALDHEPDRRMTVAILDIDAFTEINEVLGHANGDRFLQHVATIIDETVDGSGRPLASVPTSSRSPGTPTSSRRRPTSWIGSAGHCSSSSSSTASPSPRRSPSGGSTVTRPTARPSSCGGPAWRAGRRSRPTRPSSPTRRVRRGSTRTA